MGRQVLLNSTPDPSSTVGTRDAYVEVGTCSARRWCRSFTGKVTILHSASRPLTLPRPGPPLLPGVLGAHTPLPETPRGRRHLYTRTEVGRHAVAGPPRREPEDEYLLRGQHVQEPLQPVGLVRLLDAAGPTPRERCSTETWTPPPE